MEEQLGAQNAIQIAVQTLMDRCRNFQQRIVVLEEENVNLRIQCSRNVDKEYSASEIDKLKELITELTQQKAQLLNKIKMVTNENQELWGKLGKLTHVNKSLGSQLSKINDTLTQHTSSVMQSQHIPLIRSKTFTQDEPHTKILQKNLEANDKISLELEDVSLKLNDSFSKQRKELDMLCTEIADIQFSDIIMENFGFCYDDELENDLIDEFKMGFEDLTLLREEVLKQREALSRTLKNVENLKANSHCKTCELRKNMTHKSTSTEDIPKTKSEDKYTEIRSNYNEKYSPTKVLPVEAEKICPMCTKMFSKDVEFTVFQQHVEQHFCPDEDSYEML